VCPRGTVYWYGFRYDNVGNLLQKLDLTTSPATVLTELAYNAADQITSDGFDYDDRGNMLSEHRPETQNGDWTYEYDTQNRLTHAYDGTNNFYYGYDGDGHRVKQTVNQIVTEFVVDLNGGLSQVVADINSGGNLKVLYVRGDDLISQFQNSAWHWYSYDGHGSTIALTDDAADQADFYQYDAWGNPLDSAEHPLNRFRYTGQEEDDTGLYYLRARYYGPRLGRFGSRDPVMGSECDPRTLHRYSYCKADPGNRVDPAGLQELTGLLWASVIIGVLTALTATVYLYAHGWALWKAALVGIGLGVLVGVVFYATGYALLEEVLSLGAVALVRGIVAMFVYWLMCKLAGEPVDWRVAFMVAFIAVGATTGVTLWVQGAAVAVWLRVVITALVAVGSWVLGKAIRTWVGWDKATDEMRRKRRMQEPEELLDQFEQDMQEATKSLPEGSGSQ
jgi:RHS repeat-associated protein